MARQVDFKALAKRYPTPKQVQRYLRNLKYNREKKGETLRSAAQAIKKGEAHCLEASILAAAILAEHGYPPLLLCMDSSDNLNHCVFLFRGRTGWGAIGRSREPGLHGRAPYFKTIRALALSYVDPFVDKTGSFIGYHTISLDETGADWKFSKRNVWRVDKLIVGKKYKKYRMSRARFKKLKAAYLERGPIQKGKHWW